MLYKHMIPAVLVLMIVGLAIGCGGPATQPEEGTTESISQGEEGALESSMEMKHDLMKTYIDSTEETLAKLDDMIKTKKEEAAQLEEDARITMEQHLELIQEKRDKVDTLLNEMKYDLDELMAAIKGKETEAVGEVEDTFYSEFEKKKEALEKAITELEDVYKEVFPEKDEGMTSE
ncbi:MAG: hypothetical protein JW885_05810 [Deltaproteobacteria bacterium]|nr:hypothetical protein [Candidatus Zymogenaceae bacterium]